MKPPLNHMMQHNDALAEDFERILGYRTSHAGLVLPAAGGGDPPGAGDLTDESGEQLTDESGEEIVDE